MSARPGKFMLIQVRIDDEWHDFAGMNARSWSVDNTEIEATVADSDDADDPLWSGTLAGTKAIRLAGTIRCVNERAERELFDAFTTDDASMYLRIALPPGNTGPQTIWGETLEGWFSILNVDAPAGLDTSAVLDVALASRSAMALSTIIPPGAPPSLSALASAESAILTWVNGAAGAQPLIGVQYRVRAGGGAWGVWRPMSGGLRTTFTVLGLTNGQSYTFQVRNLDGSGAASLPSPESNSVTPSTGWLVADGTSQPDIDQSSDQGMNWTQYASTPGFRPYAFAVASPSELLAVGLTGSAATIHHTTDGGDTWATRTPPGDIWTSIAIDAAVTPAGEWLILNGNNQQNYILTSIDDGVSWSGQIPVPDEGSGRPTGVDVTPAGLWLVLSGGRLYWSNNRGQTWNWFGQILTGLGTVFSVKVDAEGTYHALNTQGQIYMSTDQGTTWSAAISPSFPVHVSGSYPFGFLE